MKLNLSAWPQQALYLLLFISWGCLFLLYEDKEVRNFRRELIKTGSINVHPFEIGSIAESFYLELQCEEPDFPFNKLVRSKAWGHLQNKVSNYVHRAESYEQRTELLREQEEAYLTRKVTMLHWVAILCWIGLGLSVFLVWVWEGYKGIK